MQHITKLKLAAIHQLCDVEDISTERMYAYMQDIVKVDVDTINSYMVLGDANHVNLFKEVNSLTEVMINIGNTNQRRKRDKI